MKFILIILLLYLFFGRKERRVLPGAHLPGIFGFGMGMVLLRILAGIFAALVVTAVLGRLFFPLLFFL